MKSLWHIVVFCALLLTGSSCVKTYSSEDSTLVKLKIRLVFPEAYKNVVDITKLPVVLENKRFPMQITAYPGTDSVAVFNVTPDRYEARTSFMDSVSRLTVNGLCNEFLLSAEGIAIGQGVVKAPALDMKMNVAEPGTIIIRELYYHGCSTLVGGANYTKDRYVEIYNNNGEGGEDCYLDSLCLAAVFPYNSTGGNTAWKGADTLAIDNMYWMVPGDGQTYPLKPGESVVIALIAAVDHSTRCTSGLHLEKAHFGCYDESLSGHEIAAGVPRMVFNMVGQGNAWTVSIHSPAFVLFRPSMGVAQYQADALTWERYEPGKTSGRKYWHIASSWIIDGVECFDSPTGGLKRLPSPVDASYCCMTLPHYSGRCISRKVNPAASTPAVTVYMDTNNSANDFDVDMELHPRLKQ